MASDVREQLMEWMTGTDTCFLLGAGCSKCAGKPLIGELTNLVLKGAGEYLSKQFQKLRPASARPATIEDLINYLVRYRGILSTITSDDSHSITITQIERWLTYIKKEIVRNVTDDWEASSSHQLFLQRLGNLGEPRDIFSLNYDTLLEASLDDLRLPYIDGFRGINRAWFDVGTFDEKTEAAFRIFKLHGSINWTRDDDGHVRRGRDLGGENKPIVVYPSEQKYLQTQYGVYETLIGRFRDRLRISRVNNCLVVLGYSFHDEHINEAISDSINARDSNLTVLAFVGPEDDCSRQNERLNTFGARCDSRFNAFIGSGETGHVIGDAVNPEAARIILNADLWKFEKLVEFIAGETP